MRGEYRTSRIDSSRDCYEAVLGLDADDTVPSRLYSTGERSFYCLDPHGNRLCFVDETTLFLGHGADWS